MKFQSAALSACLLLITLPTALCAQKPPKADPALAASDTVLLTTMEKELRRGQTELANPCRGGTAPPSQEASRSGTGCR